jgi:BMFP domain-containing protein YqiC
MQPVCILICSRNRNIHDEAASMLDPKILDDISRRISENLPRGVQDLQDDLQRNLRTGVESALGRLNLVTREEFEIQQAVLQRTREKLEALEARVAEMEAGTDD